MLYKAYLPCLATVLAGCVAQAPDTGTALDPRRTDYADLKVFLSVPDGIALQTGSPNLMLQARLASGEVSAAKSRLVPVEDARGQAYRIPARDLRAIRDVVRVVQTADQPGSSTIAIGVDACRFAPGPDGPLGISIATAAEDTPTLLVADALQGENTTLPRCQDDLGAPIR